MIELTQLSHPSRANDARNPDDPDANSRHRQQDVSEIFSNTIREVEDMINDALSISRQASEEPKQTFTGAEREHLQRKAKISQGISPVVKLPSLPRIAGYPSLESAHVKFPLSRDELVQEEPRMPHDGHATLPPSPPLSQPSAAVIPLHDQEDQLARRTSLRRALTSGGDVRDHVPIFEEPQPEKRSKTTREERQARRARRGTTLSPVTEAKTPHVKATEIHPPTSDETFSSSSSLDDEEKNPLLGPSSTIKRPPSPSAFLSPNLRSSEHAARKSHPQPRARRQRLKSKIHHLDLRNRRHIDLEAAPSTTTDGTSPISDLRAPPPPRLPLARDWPLPRKRLTALIACLNTLLISLLLGLYAGSVPAIQYALGDQHHTTILGNLFFYLGLSIPVLFLWPLPLLHGRKPYTIMALANAAPLQIPQGLAVNGFRDPGVRGYRVVLLMCRGLEGLALGFLAMNAMGTLLDVWGASLMSGNPHQEVVDPWDVRRHGGGMGVWLGVWSWCTLGGIATGFLVGAAVVERYDSRDGGAGAEGVSTGFWIGLVLLSVMLVVNVLAPEVRRSRHRRTAEEIWSGTGKWKRVARGEVKMHLVARGPLWWGEEVKWGWEMSRRMLSQPGFAVLAVYIAWVYAQFTLIMMLLGALISKSYHFRPTLVGVCIFSLALGALLATPFQTASFFSRSRHHAQRTDSMTFETQVRCSSHLIRRLIFMIFLPLSAVVCTVTSAGPPIPAVVSALAAAVLGFLSNLAVAECYGLVMEAFDTSDLPTGAGAGTGGGRRDNSPEEKERDYRRLKERFTSYPRVSAGFAVSQGLGYVLAAAATGTGGAIERHLGAEQATAVMASVLMGLTGLLTAVLVRWKSVRMVPDLGTRTRKGTGLGSLTGMGGRFGIGSRSRRGTGLGGKGELQLAEEEQQPLIVIGNPSGVMRRVNVLELGSQSRWAEIRRRNRVLEGW
ncbi:MAG: hypothetical protein Q9160_008122 [Pyrenula sp. 1 TL-2023]